MRNIGVALGEKAMRISLKLRATSSRAEEEILAFVNRRVRGLRGDAHATHRILKRCIHR
jgi:hypothetical protein